MPKPGVKWVEIGPHRLALGDCLDVAISPDVVITDPPYGNVETHNNHLSGVILKNGEPAGQALGFIGITKEQCLNMAQRWVRTSKRWVVFTCEWKYMLALHDAGILVRFGIWRKPDGSPQFTGDRPGTGWEGVAICHRPGKKRWNGGGKHAFWNFSKYNPDGKGHPTAKPLKLFEDFVLNFSDEGETVFDPFMGSGTTGVACLRTGRKFIGIEKDPKWFNHAVGRISTEWRALNGGNQPEQQVKMFGEEG